MNKKERVQGVEGPRFQGEKIIGTGVLEYWSNGFSGL
jgi:hypothetical protein